VKGQWIGLGLALACAACGKAPEPPAKTTVVAGAPGSHVAPEVPADQLVLVKAIAAGRNDPDFCVTFQATRAFQDWAVKIGDFRTSTINRSIDITFEAGDSVLLEQVVQTTDALYPSIEALRVGETARISGAFTHGNGECGFRLGVIGVKVAQINGTSY